MKKIKKNPDTGVVQTIDGQGNLMKEANERTGLVTNYDPQGNVTSKYRYQLAHGPSQTGFNSGEASKPRRKPNYAGAVGGAAAHNEDDNPLPLPTMNFGHEQAKKHDASDDLPLPVMNFDAAQQAPTQQDDNLPLPSMW